MQKSLTKAVLIGALFAIRMPCGAATPSLTTLYSFPGPTGAFPEAGLVLNNGALFGTAYTGGSDWGTVFELSQSGGVWSIYSSPGPTGAFPEAGLVLNNGALFGTAYTGGSDWGTVFELSQSGGVWSINQLYAFTGGVDGANPRAGVIFSSRGVIFGTTEQGGASGYGTVFSLTPATGGKFTQKVIYSFTGQGGDGANPEAGLVLSPKSGVLVY